MRQITSLLILLKIASLTTGQSCPGDPNASNSPALPENSAIYKCNSKKTKCHFECTGSGKSFYNPTNLKYKSNGYLTCENGVFKSNLGKSWSCENVARCYQPDLVLEKNNNKFKTLEEDLDNGFQLKAFQIKKSKLEDQDLGNGWTLVLDLTAEHEEVRVTSVNSKFASFTSSNKSLIVTSHARNQDLIKIEKQSKIGSNSLYGVVLSFENAFKPIKVKAASIYFTEYLNIDCLTDENMTLLKSDCTAFDSNFDAPRTKFCEPLCGDSSVPTTTETTTSETTTPSEPLVWDTKLHQKWTNCACHSHFEHCLSENYNEKTGILAECNNDRESCRKRYQEDAEFSMYNVNGTEYDTEICAQCDGKTEEEYVTYCSDGCLEGYQTCEPYCKSLFNVYGNWFKDYSEEYYGESVEFFCEMDFDNYE